VAQVVRVALLALRNLLAAPGLELGPELVELGLPKVVQQRLLQARARPAPARAAGPSAGPAQGGAAAPAAGARLAPAEAEEPAAPRAHRAAAAPGWSRALMLLRQRLRPACRAGQLGPCPMCACQLGGALLALQGQHTRLLGGRGHAGAAGGPGRAIDLD